MKMSREAHCAAARRWHNMKNKRVIITLVVLIILSFLGSLYLGQFPRPEEPIKEAMKDAVLHEVHKVQLGPLQVNPALISAYIVSAILILLALAFRFFLFPRFKEVPGKLQNVVETLVEYFAKLAQTHSGHRPMLVGGYCFAAGVYIALSTLFELAGWQVISTDGLSLSLPAPISDINAAIAMGFTSYGFILMGGLVANGIKGVLQTLKDFSLPISMSFRLFGALLGGLLVNELVYHYYLLSFGLPVIIAVLFTLLHAVIQAYVLTMLVAIFYGEATEPHTSKKVAKNI